MTTSQSQERYYKFKVGDKVVVTDGVLSQFASKGLNRQIEKDAFDSATELIGKTGTVVDQGSDPEWAYYVEFDNAGFETGLDFAQHELAHYVNLTDEERA